MYHFQIITVLLFAVGWKNGSGWGHLKRSSWTRSLQVSYLRTRMPWHQETFGKNTQGRILGRLEENFPPQNTMKLFCMFNTCPLRSNIVQESYMLLAYSIVLAHENVVKYFRSPKSFTKRCFWIVLVANPFWKRTSKMMNRLSPDK